MLFSSSEPMPLVLLLLLTHLHFFWGGGDFTVILLVTIQYYCYIFRLFLCSCSFLNRTQASINQRAFIADTKF